MQENPGKPDSNDTDHSDLLDSTRRGALKLAGAGIGAVSVGGTLLGSATAATTDGDCVQVDFVTGTSEITDLSTGTYSDSGRLLAYQWAETVNNDTTGESGNRTSKTDSCTINASGPTIDFAAGTASVDYTLSSCNGDQDLLLVSYRSSCNGDASNPGWDPANADQQTVYDTATATTQSDGSLTVDLDGIPTTGLSRWELEGDGSDTWGSNSGSLQNGASYVPDSKVGSSAMENTNGGHFEVPNDSTLNLSPPFSLTAWIKINTLQSGFRRIINRDGGNTSFSGINPYSFGYMNQNGSPAVRLQIGNGSTTEGPIGNTTFSTGTYVHIGAVIGESELRVYLNGQRDATTNRTIDPTTVNDSLYIGNDDLANPGLIVDDPRIYDFELSDANMKALYNRESLYDSNNNTTRSTWNRGTLDGTSADRDDESGRLGLGYVSGGSAPLAGSTTQPLASLVGQWRLDESYGSGSSGDTVSDYSGNGYDGTTRLGVDTGRSGPFSTNAYDTDVGSNANGYIEITENVFDATQGVSFAFWYKWNGTTSGDFAGYITDRNDQTDNWSLQVSNGDGDGNGDDTVSLLVSDANGNDSSATKAEGVLTANKWHFIVVTYDPNNGDEGKIYVDADQKSRGTASLSAANVSSGLDIGNYFDHNGFGIHGEFAEVMVFETVLSQSEVTGLYLNGRDGTYNGSYTSDTISESSTQSWNSVDTESLVPTNTSVDMIFEVSDDGFSTVEDSETISLVGGVETHSLNVQNATDARVRFDGDSTDVERTWEIKSYTVNYTTA
jgi:hypothetical protein